MSAWAEASMRVGERATAAAGLPAHSEPQFVAQVFVPDEHIRMMLSGLVSDEEIDEAVRSCHVTAHNALIAMALSPTPSGAHASLACIVAHMYALGIVYGEARG